MGPRKEKGKGRCISLVGPGNNGPYFVGQEKGKGKAMAVPHFAGHEKDKGKAGPNLVGLDQIKPKYGLGSTKSSNQQFSNQAGPGESGMLVHLWGPPGRHKKGRR